MSNLIRWNPLREMAAMQNAMDRLFEETWRGARGTLDAGALALDLHENEDTFIVTTELPGVPADKINVSLDDGVLTITGEVEKVTPAEGTKTLMQERVYGRFTRSIRLPVAVNSDAVNAHYDHGVLMLTLPKAEAAKPRLIPVRVGDKK